jgi:hypothetical protein
MSRLAVLALALGPALGMVLAAAQLSPAAPAPLELAQEHASATCGFSFRFPNGWRDQEELDRTVRLLSPERGQEFFVRGVQVDFGPIRDVRLTQISADQLAQSAVGGYCLLCLQGRLVWVDRFTQGSITGRYLMEQRDITREATTVPHYRLQFYLSDNGSSRGLAPNGWTWARAVAWIPVARFAEMQVTVFSIVRSLRFTAASQPENVCWPQQSS